jgi:hypothetical protein
MSALNITVSASLPKNEKDLICMLLAGRLKDLFKGKLICAQLALGDLLADATGVAGLGALAGAITGMQAALTSFQAISGYDKILAGVNQALGQIENVFSLGGLCPSPVHAPKIPDLLPQLNANLFGQANNILSALGKLSNPSMCLGGGPKGFGINWNSMTGDLKNLKAAIAQAKATGLGMTPALNAFTNNLKSQTSRLKSEISRLEKNLADPLGINEKQNTVKSLQRAKDISDGYTVKDANGIEYANALKAMVAGDVEAVFDRTGLDAQPVRYVSKPILDYCGDVIGYEKVALSGDPAYIGWDTAPGATNTDNPTVNPTATFANFDYLFKEENSVITIYNTAGETVTNISLARGKHYRIGLELANSSMKFYSDSSYTTPWVDGLTYSRSPAYGTDMEIITPDTTTTYIRGEVDWAVLIENPTTPNTLYWKATNDQHGTFDIDPTSPTVIPLADRTYDLSMAARKSGLHLIHSNDYGVNHEVSITTRTYNSVNTRYGTNNQVITPIATQANLSYSIIDDLETLDSNNATNSNNKIIKSVSKFNTSGYLIIKRYVSMENGYEFNKLYVYISSDGTEATASHCLLIKFDSPLVILNSSKLPFTDNYSYKLTYLKNEGTVLAPNFVPVMSPISNSNKTTFELVESNGKQYIRWNLSSYSEADTENVPKNEFIYQTDIEIDPTHLKRDFINSDPVETRTYFYFKIDNNASIKSVITLNV